MQMRLRKSEVSNFRSRRGGPAPTYNPGVNWQPCENLELDWGEKVLWQGKPVKGAYMLTYGRQSIVITILALFFPIVAIVAGLVDEILALLAIGSIMLAIILVGLTLGTRKKLKQFPKEEYMLTDRRVLRTGDSITGCQSIALSDFYQVLISYTFLDRFYRTGSLVFSNTQEVDFSCISDPESVRKSMVGAVMKARKGQLEEAAL